MSWLSNLFSTNADPTPQPEPPAAAAEPAPASGPFKAADLAAAGIAPERIATYLAPLNAACVEFDINTPARAAQFLAQVTWESEEFKYTREIWGPTAAQQSYDGRRDLGNYQRGDGFKFRGAGLIELTGRGNFSECSAALFGNPSVLVNNPDKLAEPATSCRAAAWFWHSRGCNELADAGNFTGITRKINGGLNGLQNRLDIYEQIAREMGLL